MLEKNVVGGLNGAGQAGGGGARMMNNTGTKRACVRGPRSESAPHVMVDEAGVVHVGQDLQRGGRRRSRDLKSSACKIYAPLAASRRGRARRRRRA